MKSLSQEKIFSQLLKITISLFTHLRKVLVYIKWSRYELAGNILGRSYVPVHKHKTAVERSIGGRNFRRIKIIIASLYSTPSVPFVPSLPCVLPSYICSFVQNTTLVLDASQTA